MNCSGALTKTMAVDPIQRLRFSLPVAEGRKLALVHGLGRVLNSELRDSEMVIDAELPASLVRLLQSGAVF